MKKIITASITGIAFVIIFLSCRNAATTSIQYPLSQPDAIPLPFMPGIVTTDKLDFNACYSPDGKSFYFARSKNKK